MAAAPPSPSPHRLHAISASQAISAAQPPQSHIPTSSHGLDRTLRGGLPLAKVSELLGPPGCGKTAIAMQIAANALISGLPVVWIDTTHPLPTARLVSMISAAAQPEGDPLSYLSQLHLLQCPTLAHLLALFLHPRPSFPPERTALVVIDNIATLFAAAYPPGHEDFNNKDRAQSPNNGGSSPRGKPTPRSPAPQKDSPSARKFTIMADLIKSLSHLALQRKLAVLVLNQMTTKVIPGSGAVLQPAVQSPMWHISLTSRMLVHRNDISPSVLSNPAAAPMQQIRFVTVLKAVGVAHDGTTGMKAPVVVVQIKDEGIEDVELVRKEVRSSPQVAAVAPVEVTVSAPVPATVTVTMRAQNAFPSPLRSPAPTPKPRERSVEMSPVRKKRKRGLEAGVIAGSDEEDSDEGWESGLDDDGLGVALLTPLEDGVQVGFVKPAAGG